MHLSELRVVEPDLEEGVDVARVAEVAESGRHGVPPEQLRLQLQLLLLLFHFQPCLLPQPAQASRVQSINRDQLMNVLNELAFLLTYQN